MNNSDNSREFKQKSSKSAVRKGLVLGAIVGASISIIVQFLYQIIASRGESAAVWVLFRAWDANQAMARFIYQLFGLSWKTGDEAQIPFVNFCLMVAVNSVFLALVGGVIGSLMRRQSNQRSNDRAGDL